MKTRADYEAFLARRADRPTGSGLVRVKHDSALYPFQHYLVEWALRLGRSAIFADCGLGKTPMQLVWAENVVQETNRPVLIITPLAVARQTLREAEKFDIAASLVKAGALEPGIWVTNYERLHHLDCAQFSGIVCDESSILKNFDGVRRKAITDAMRNVPFRLLCTATAAPNDYIELGTSSEALGHLGHMDMLSRFFVNDQNSSHPNRLISGAKWRFKGHAQGPFWRWVSSWAQACRAPSDLGFTDDGFALPPLIETPRVVESTTQLPGELFKRPAMNIREERVERKQTLEARCELAARLVDHNEPAVIWCHLNVEGDRLSKAIPDAIEVSGALDDDEKAKRFDAFTTGAVRVLIVKPKIGAWGLNWQHCAHVVTFGSHSYEQYYQSVRRCWRYGQTRPVRVDAIVSEGEARVFANLRRKAAAADEMFRSLVAHMHEAHADRPITETTEVQVPQWISPISA